MFGAAAPKTFVAGLLLGGLVVWLITRSAGQTHERESPAAVVSGVVRRIAKETSERLPSDDDVGKLDSFVDKVSGNVREAGQATARKLEPKLKAIGHLFGGDDTDGTSGSPSKAPPSELGKPQKPSQRSR